MEIAKGKIGNAITSTAQDHVVAVAHDIYDENQERYQDDINDYVLDQIFDINQALGCFSSGLWENDLHWSNVSLWDNNKYAITDALAEDVKELDTHLSNSDQAFKDAMLANAKEHGLVNAHLQKHDGEILNLQNLIKEHDQQIIDLIDTLACFSDGYWDNGLKWSNQALWENSNLMYDTFEDIYSQIETHQASINNLTKEIQKVKSDAESSLQTVNKTFNDFRKEHDAFRNEHKEFSKEHDDFRKEHQTITGRLDGLDTQCEGQQHEIDSLLYRISILTNGIWDNNLLWVNESEWINTNRNGTCHCPEDTEERLDKLQESFDSITQRVSDTEVNIENITSDVEANTSAIGVNISSIADNASEIEQIKQNAITEHRNVAYQLRAIGREQIVQDENIAKLGEHFSCYADGIWGDLFIWDNELLWANKTGVINEIISDLRNDLHDTRYKLNEANEDIMTNLSLIQANRQIIETNFAGIQENKKAIETTQSELQSDTEEIRKEALIAHRQIAYQLRAIAREQTAQDNNISKLGEHFGCFVDGVWGDLFLWDNDHLWHNKSGVIEEALADTNDRIDAVNEEIENINHRAEEHQSEYQKMLDDIRAYTGCFEKGEWANPFFWNDTDVWFNTPNGITEVENDIISHDNRLTTLENQFALFIQQFATQQTIIEQHRNQLETLMDCFTVLNVGKWQNLLLWDNASKWSDVLITEVAADSGAPTVAVKQYDPETQTLSI